MKKVKLRPVKFQVIKSYQSNVTIYVPENVEPMVDLSTRDSFWENLYKSVSEGELDEDWMELQYWGRVVPERIDGELPPKHLCEDLVVEEDLETITSLEEFGQKHLIVK